MPKLLLLVELRGSYRLTGEQTFEVLVDGAGGASGDLDVTITAGLAAGSRRTRGSPGA